MFLELTNNLTKITTILSEITDKNTSTLFYSFDIILEDSLEDGEYTYRLMEEDKILASGLMMIGDFKRDTDINNEYNENKKGYIVYGE